MAITEKPIRFLKLICSTDGGLFTRKQIEQGPGYAANLAATKSFLLKEKGSWEKAGFENLVVIEER